MRMGWHQTPNLLTLLRFVLIVPFAMAILHTHYLSALVLFFIAGLSDGADGFLARRFNWHSRFGAIADPLADKALLVVAYLMLTLVDQLPWWLFGWVLGRDLVILCGALAFHYCISRYEMQPSLLGKLNTFVQIIFVLVLLMILAGGSTLAPERWVAWGAWLVVLVALLSGLHYVVVWSARAWQLKKP